jgi:hypothetical protein
MEDRERERQNILKRYPYTYRITVSLAAVVAWLLLGWFVFDDHQSSIS